MNNIQLYLGDSKEVLRGIESNSIDSIITDPPYQLASITKRFGKEGSAPCQFGKDGAFQRVSKGFMGKEWDILPPVELWKECLRVLKPGAFAFIMTTPRQDSLCQILMDLSQAGFVMGFSSIYWTYASGFPKAMNVSKKIDKQQGLKRTGIIRTDGIASNSNSGCYNCNTEGENSMSRIFEDGNPISEEAKILDGTYSGFQPKPAVEIIIVCMKPLSEKNYIEQAKENGKGITHLDDCRIPYDKNYKPSLRGNLNSTSEERNYGYKDNVEIGSEKGRFPANLLVSDDILNDGKVSKSPLGKVKRQPRKGQVFTDKTSGFKSENLTDSGYGDSGSYSRYFSLDNWWEERIKNLPEEVKKVFPFLICPKASKNEKNKGLENLPKKQKIFNGQSNKSSKEIHPVEERFTTQPTQNIHPTVKPIKLMSYLITLGSREGDIILDPFAGSCTTGIACKILGRKFIGIEMNKEYLDIGMARIKGGI